VKKDNITGLIVLAGVGFLLFSKPGQKLLKKGQTTGDQAVKFFLNVDHKLFIEDLNPAVKNKFTDLIQAIQDRGYNVLITSGYRSFKSQNKLYQENKKNARPGYSLHNYGLAIDINLQKGLKLWKKNTDRQAWISTGIPDLAKNLGFRWGGDFKDYFDPIHFDLYYKTDNLLSIAKKTFGSDPDLIKGNQVSLSGLVSIM
jgi:peptidoglycan L-alanyl-D-glutamate endopeptidase CwlK